MVLPPGINKATGLRAALKDLKLSPHNVVGIGDAENDSAFLNLSGCAVAVANALPSIKEIADIVTNGARGGRRSRDHRPTERERPRPRARACAATSDRAGRGRGRARGPPADARSCGARSRDLRFGQVDLRAGRARAPGRAPVSVSSSSIRKAITSTCRTPSRSAAATSHRSSRRSLRSWMNPRPTPR